MLKGAREPGEPRPAQEPPLRPGGTAPQTCKANDAGERRAQRLPRPAPHPSGTAVAPVAADGLAAPILSPPRGGAPAVWQMPRPCSFVPASPPVELDTAPQKRLPDLSLGRGSTPASPLLHEAHCTSPLPKTCSVPQGLASVPRAQTHPASLPPVRPQSPSSSQRTSCRFGHSHFCGHGVTHARIGLPRWVLFLYQRWGLTGLSLMPWGGAHARAHRESWTLRD